MLYLKKAGVIRLVGKYIPSCGEYANVDKQRNYCSMVFVISIVQSIMSLKRFKINKNNKFNK